MKTTEKQTELIIKGQPVSPGIAIGNVFILDDDYIETREEKVNVSNIPFEIERFRTAVDETIKDLQLLIDQIGSQVTAQQREIFDSHQMILEDKVIIKETTSLIKNEQINADHAYFRVMRQYQRDLDSAKDSYLRERAIDIRDIKRRVIRKMSGQKRSTPGALRNSIIVANELNLFDLRQLAKNEVAGVVLEGGGRTSHIAIMIKSLELPAIFGAESILKKTRKNDTIVVNGITGEVLIHPTSSQLKKCERKRKSYQKFKKDYLRVASLPSETLDGALFEINANIEFPFEIDTVSMYGKFGIGLYRTEYDFMEAENIPTEEELYENYVHIVKKLNPHTVTIRTIDIGGDKIAPYINTGYEKNPFLGWRAIRICLDMPDLFRKQLRAIIRASAWGKIKLMFPMIATLEEVRQAKLLVNEVIDDLRSQKFDFDNNIPVGIMIEVPSAVVMADQLAKEVDFFSIGTNDLIQYTLAVDRTNAKVAKYYNYFDPSVIRLIRMTVKAANNRNIPVGMCGEMAGYPLAAPLLLGLGISEFSVSPVLLLKIKQILRSINMADARKISKQCLRMHTTKEIASYLRNYMMEYFPGMNEDNFFKRKSS